MPVAGWGSGLGVVQLARMAVGKAIPFVVHLRDCSEGMVASWSEGDSFGDPRFQHRVKAGLPDPLLGV